MFDFQSEALTRIGAAAPELSAHVLSFQDLSQELPEGTNYSVGIFIIGAPAGLLYVPAIAYGMVVQPFDSIIDAATGTFMPFTNTFIQKALMPQMNNYGKATKVPKYVSTNPSIYNLVVPPRTGKVAYASAEQPLEMVSALPKAVRMALLAKIKTEPAVASAIGNTFELQDFLRALNYEAAKPTVSVANPEVEIVTPANAASKNLENAQIQEILNQGYTIVGDNITPRMVVPVENATDAFGKLSGAREGTATMLVMRDGTRLLAMIPKLARKMGSIKQTTLASRGISTDNRKSGVDGEPLAIGVDGRYFTNSQIVTAGAELEMSEAVKEIYNAGRIVPVSSISSGECFVVVTDKGVIGPMMATRVLRKGDDAEINVMFSSDYMDIGERRMLISTPTFKGGLHIDDSSILVGSAANAIVLSYDGCMDAEVSVTSAFNRQQLHTMGLLEGKLSVVNHGGPFTVNGKTQDNEAELARTLIVRIGMSKQAAVAAIETAKTKGRAEFYLSKEASAADNYDDIPQYGNPAMEQPPLIESQPIVDAGQTADPEIMGNVLISQFMNNPDVFEMISSYTPQMAESVDKLGRSILLLRLNTDADKAASVMNILAATRNTYRLLGDTVEKLKRLSDGHATTK